MYYLGTEGLPQAFSSLGYEASKHLYIYYFMQANHFLSTVLPLALLD